VWQDEPPHPGHETTGARVSRDPSPSPWWDPARHADRRPFLAARNRIKRAIRSYFEDEGFTEVDTACLQVSPGNETHLHAFRTELVGTDLATRSLYLRTSPEFACKKLLAAGERRIFTFAPVFRNRERGALHHPEFTMVEWYRAEEPYERVMEDCTALVRLAAEAAGSRQLRWRDRVADPSALAERVTVADALARRYGIDLLATVDGAHGDASRLAGAAEAAAIPCAGDDDWSDVFSRLVVDLEPDLGNGRATLLTEYPIPAAALARAKPADPRVAERFELYACGVELANGFGELTDPVLQRRRLAAEMDEKARRYGERYPVDEDFLAALAIMPPAAGCALGLERLVMLTSGAPSIESVVWTPLP
jgi:lysyl-tRNA synthetase class 2